MLYLFGQLALSDALFYHEDFQDNYQLKNTTGPQRLATLDARAAAVSRRLRRNRHFPQPARATARCFGS